MKHLIISIMIISLLSLPVSADKLPDELLVDAIDVLREIQAQPDSHHFQAVLAKASGVAIFPSVIKAGLGFGGRYGEGLILRYDQKTKTWYGPYFANLKGLSYGFQVGIQSTALVLVITNEQGMRDLQSGKVTLGGNLSVSTGPLGRSAEAGTDLELSTAIYSYSLSKGAFIGASLEGAAINNSVNANQVYWQEKLTPTQILERKASKEAVVNLIEELDSFLTNHLKENAK